MDRWLWREVVAAEFLHRLAVSVISVSTRRVMLNALVFCLLAACPTPPGRAPIADTARALIVPVRTGGGPPPIADSVVIEKRAHRLTLYHMGRPIKRYLVALGGNPVGNKRYAGDRRTPEGLFSIDSRNPKSDYYLALHISYPDSAHRTQAEALGLSPGGDIAIHGLGSGRRNVGAYHRTADWTDGCVALTNEEMESVWNVVSLGTPVEIKP
jgi:murein L,D-transpeptidase YafK